MLSTRQRNEMSSPKDICTLKLPVVRPALELIHWWSLCLKRDRPLAVTGAACGSTLCPSPYSSRPVVVLLWLFKENSWKMFHCWEMCRTASVAPASGPNASCRTLPVTAGRADQHSNRTNLHCSSAEGLLTPNWRRRNPGEVVLEGGNISHDGLTCVVHSFLPLWLT